MAQKWGESFLKSGLPLEHLTLVTFKTLGWECEPRYEYQRRGQLTYFEIDLIAYSPSDERGDLLFLVECKYHDEQRFWFFLPCSTVDHQAQYEAMSAGENLESDEHVVHFAPYSPLADPDKESLLTLAPKTTWGVTVSRSGAKEQNSIQEALDQLAYGFVPFCLDRLYNFCASYPKAVIPMIVTTAKLFCLRPQIYDVDGIRKANSPSDIADELSWTWCYYAPRGELQDYNMDEINEWKREHPVWQTNWHTIHPLKAFPPVESQLIDLWSFPHWVVVANIEGLHDATQAIYSQFLQLPMDFSLNEQLGTAIETATARKRDGRSEDH